MGGQSRKKQNTIIKQMADYVDIRNSKLIITERQDHTFLFGCFWMCSDAETRWREKTKQTEDK